MVGEVEEEEDPKEEEMETKMENQYPKNDLEIMEMIGGGNQFRGR